MRNAPPSQYRNDPQQAVEYRVRTYGGAHWVRRLDKKTFCWSWRWGRPQTEHTQGWLSLQGKKRAVGARQTVVGVCGWVYVANCGACYTSSRFRRSLNRKHKKRPPAFCLKHQQLTNFNLEQISFIYICVWYYTAVTLLVSRVVLSRRIIDINTTMRVSYGLRCRIFFSIWRLRIKPELVTTLAWLILMTWFLEFREVAVVLSCFLAFTTLAQKMHVTHFQRDVFYFSRSTTDCRR